MNKALLNYVVDVFLGISFILAGITGILKWPGLVPAIGLTHRSLPMQQLTQIHDWSGLIMVILVAVHLVLHWKWIVCVTKSIFCRFKKECKLDKGCEDEN